MSAANLGTPPAPLYSPDEKEHRREIASVLNRVVGGKLNATIDVTLTANAATTTVNDARIGYYSFICPYMALTAHGADDLTWGIWVDNIMSTSCRLNHRTDHNTDRTLRVLIIG